MAVHRRAVLPAPPARVWEALTDDALLSRWFGADVRLDPVPGGRGSFRGSGGTRTARVHEVERHRRLAFTWDDDDGTVALVLTEVAGGTRLDVVETPPPAAGTVPLGGMHDASAGEVECRVPAGVW